MNKQDIQEAIKAGSIKYCCFNCRDKYSTEPTQDNIFTCHEGKCEICDKRTIVSSAKKLFGCNKLI